MDGETAMLLRRAQTVFSSESRLLSLPSHGRLVIVGDTHGDVEATEHVLHRFRKTGATLLFLGDYVDRGPRSQENITLLLREKIKNPLRLFLLQGNHEGWKATRFSPGNFWQSLDQEEEKLFADTLSMLPFMAHAENGLICSHGALPDVPSLPDVNGIVFGSMEWRQIAWGDWQDEPLGYVGDAGGRLQFGRMYFDDVMKRFGKTILVRAHQPGSPLFLFEDRCVTLMTSKYYAPVRRIAICDMEKTMQTGKKLLIEEL